MDPSLQRLERYQVLEEVGRGGMAVVYRGRDQSLDREVAIKVLHAHLADAPESRARFQQEARAVAKLRHRNIIEIYDFADSETGDGPSYIVTEFIAGRTLRDFLQDQPLFFPELAALLGIEICEAIGHAHSLGIIHRDLKPENMMITQAGQLKLMDFGIAKVIDQQQQMTMTGSILGSPAHMAPEMLEGKDLDVRSDLFSLGTILYWLATGQLPFAGKNPHQVLRRILENDYPDPQQVNPELGSDLARVIKRCLADRPEERFASAGDLREALAGCLEDLELSRPAEELGRFFRDPQAWFEALRPRVCAVLLERGRRLLRARQHRPALEALDRLLAMQPGQPEALALVSGLERRRRWRRRAGWLAAGLLGAALVAAGAFAAANLRSGEPAAADAGPSPGGGASLAAADPLPARPEEPVAAAADAGPDQDAGAAAADAGAAPADARPAVAVRPPLARREDPRLPGPGARPRPPPEHEIEIVSSPFFDRIRIDGRLVATNEDLSTEFGHRLRARLPAGSHRIAIEREGCQTLEFVATIPEDPRPEDLVFRKKLRFKPASLVIDTALAEASVFVDGEYKGSAGQVRSRPIVIPLEGDSGRVEVEVRLVHPQAGESRARVVVHAGQRTTYRVPGESFDRPGGAGGGSP